MSALLGDLLAQLRHARGRGLVQLLQLCFLCRHVCGYAIARLVDDAADPLRLLVNDGGQPGVALTDILQMFIDLGGFLAQQFGKFLGAAVGRTFKDDAMAADRRGKLLRLLAGKLRQLVQLGLVAFDVGAEALRGRVRRQGHASALLIDQLLQLGRLPAGRVARAGEDGFEFADLVGEGLGGVDRRLAQLLAVLVQGDADRLLAFVQAVGGRLRHRADAPRETVEGPLDALAMIFQGGAHGLLPLAQPLGRRLRHGADARRQAIECTLQLLAMIIQCDPHGLLPLAQPFGHRLRHRADILRQPVECLIELLPRQGRGGAEALHLRAAGLLQHGIVGGAAFGGRHRLIGEARQLRAHLLGAAADLRGQRFGVDGEFALRGLGRLDHRLGLVARGLGRLIHAA